MRNVVKKLPPRRWRTKETYEKYEQERLKDVANDSCPLCLMDHISEFTHWRLLVNDYPYDGIASVHHMLVTKRHISSDRELIDEERAELFFLKESVLNESYSFIIEALPSNRSIPGHYHLHIVVPKTVT